MSQHPSNPIKTNRGATTSLELKVSGPGMNGNKRYLFEHPFVLVGRQEDNSLRLDDAAVSRRHAYLQQLGDKIYCIDLGSRTGTRWGGGARPAGWLRPDRGIQIGPFTLELANAAPISGFPGNESIDAGDPLQDRVEDLGRLPRISIEMGNKVLSQFRMNRALVLVGSSPSCRVRLRDAGISRYHCSLVRTPEGVWVVDLLGEIGTYLNDQPVRWGRVNEGDQVRVGPYVLRFSFESIGSATCSPVLPGHQTENPVQKVESPAKLVPPIVERPAPSMSDPVPALQAELGQLRQRLRVAESFTQQLAEREAEALQLREQIRTLENQVAEVGDLKARLEAAEAEARELEGLRGERDRWQAEARTAQDQLASGSTEREDLRQQLEAAQNQLHQHATDLHGVRSDVAARQAEHDAALQKLQEIQEEFTRALEQRRELQTELDQAREHQQHAETLRQQLADSGTKHDRLFVRVLELEGRATEADRLQDRLREADAEAGQIREQAQALEIQLRDLKARLEAAEASASKLEEVGCERDRWQEEAQTVQTKLASELAEREQLRLQLETVQQQLDEEREAVRAANVRLDQHTADLQVARDNFAARNADHDAAVQQLQQTQDQLTHSLDKHRELQAELDEAREHQRHAEALRQQLADSGTKHDQLLARILELEDRAAEADRLQNQLREVDTETERLRQQLQVAESRLPELETTSNECAQLREQTRALEIQLGELSELKARLESAEASARELEQQAAALQEVRAALAARTAEHEASGQQLQQAQNELARATDKQRELQAELDAAREQQQETEALRQQLTDAAIKRDQLFACVMELEGKASTADNLQHRLQEADEEAKRLRQQTHALELQVTDLNTRLEAAQPGSGNVEDISRERDHWQAEAQALQARLASDTAESEQLDSLRADLQTVQAERDRLLAEQQASLQKAEQAWARVSDLERALAEAPPTQETAVSEDRAAWESERQALQASLEQERQAHAGALQAAGKKVQVWAEGVIREVQARAASEREEWRQRLEGAEAQITWERGLFQEQGEQLRQQAAALRAERDRLAARLAQAEPLLRGAEQRSPDRAGHTGETDPMRHLAIRDQVLAEFCGIRVGQPFEPPVRVQAPNRPAEPSRPRAIHQNALPQGGQPHNQASIEQGVEAAWMQAAAGREQLATIPNEPGRADKQDPEAGSAPQPSAPVETGEASLPSETPPNEPVFAEAKQTDEEQRGIMRKILGFMLRK